MSADAASEADPGPCPDCGLGYVRGHAQNERFHPKLHNKTVNGHPTSLADGFYAVTHESPMEIQKLAEAAAITARWETKYDFPSFAACIKNVDEYKTIIAMICIRDRRVCGLLVSRERECNYTASLNSFRPHIFPSWRPTEIVEIRPHVRRAVEMIWVLKKNRRQGVAKESIQALAAHCGMNIGELAHMLPFSEDAVRLWTALKLSLVYIV